MGGIQLFFYIFGFIATIIFTAEARLSGEGIVGGDNARDSQFPYQISLEFNGQSICGGSIIDDRHIVTAAHCVTDRNGRLKTAPLKISGGIIDLKSRSSKRVVVDVVQVIIPKEYSTIDPNQHLVGDIAILKLNKDLGIASNSYLAKINLPVKSRTYAGVKAVISGFGLNKIDIVIDPHTGQPVEKNGIGYQKMRYAEANVFSQSKCQRYYADPIKIKHICAAVVQRDRKRPEGICSGDSGGPLVYKDALIGVVSTSPIGCVEHEQPAVYTRVSEYLDFINKAVNDVVDWTMLSINLPVTG